MNIVEKLQGLHHQATEERSHFYVGSVALDAVAEIMRLEVELNEARDSFHELSQRSRELAIQRNAQVFRMEKALREVLKDFNRDGISYGRYSDGEFTQDYTTRKERVTEALS